MKLLRNPIPRLRCSPHDSATAVFGTVSGCSPRLLHASGALKPT